MDSSLKTEYSFYGPSPITLELNDIPKLPKPDEKLLCQKRSAEIHRYVRKHIQSIITPNSSLIYLAEEIEHKLKNLSLLTEETSYNETLNFNSQKTSDLKNNETENFSKINLKENPKKKIPLTKINYNNTKNDLITKFNYKNKKDQKIFNFKNNLISGQAFPTGLSLNSIAAHYTPNPDSPLQSIGDTGVLKIDFGVHTFGYLIDSAFTISFDPTYNELINAAKAATEAGIRKAGPEAILCEIGAEIREVMESFTVLLPSPSSLSNSNSNSNFNSKREKEKWIEKKKEKKVKVIKNLNGHTIDRYKVHAGKTLPCYDNGDRTRMKIGEIFAIETFGSTGKGFVKDFGERNDCSHFMINEESVLREISYPHQSFKGKVKGRSNSFLKLKSSKELLRVIKQRFGGLAFCKRWISDVVGFGMGLREMEKAGMVESYPALSDVKGSMTSQFEHTVFVGEEGVEVLSRGEDY